MSLAVTSDLPTPADADAVIQQFYPGELGGLALAEIIFGDANPSGEYISVLRYHFIDHDSQGSSLSHSRAVWGPLRYSITSSRAAALSIQGTCSTTAP